MILKNLLQVRAEKQSMDLEDLAGWLGIERDTLNLRGSNALREATVFTCVKILSEAIGKLPLKIYQDENGIRRASDHYLYRILKLRPNPYMSATDYKRCLEVQRNLHGNAFAAIDFERSRAAAGRVAGLYPLNSERMTIYVDNKGLISSKRAVWYVYKDNENREVKFSADEILHFKGFSLDGISGMSTIERLKSTIETAGSAGKFLTNSYRNGMQTNGIINYTGDLSPESEKTFLKHFESMSSGVRNANKVALLPLGFTYQPIAMKLTDAQFVENTRLTLQQITAAFGIKPHQINDQTKTSYASTEEANREFYTDTLMPIITMYEEEYTYKLFLDQELKSGFYIKANPDVILRADTQKRYEAYAKAVNNGFKTPNEIRAMEEDPPKPYGDKLLVNGTMVPLEDAGKAYDKGE